MRLFTSIGMSVAVLLACLQAPFLHTHQHETTRRHPGAFFHTHFAHHDAPVSGPATWRSLDPYDDAQFLSWVAATPVDSGFIPAILPSSDIVPRPFHVAQQRLSVYRPRAHDPPALSPTSPRAPPV